MQGNGIGHSLWYDTMIRIRISWLCIDMDEIINQLYIVAVDFV